ncbi:MAG: T9SS type A sorting domain-containing protein [Gammaproteobacteria bacterium]
MNTWISPTPGTPDYFNACATGLVDVPNNWVGNQVPVTGNGYGRTLDYGYNSNYREYIQVQLTSPLVVGQTYVVEYYVSLCDNQNWAHTGPQAYLSTNAISAGNTLPLPYVPQVSNPTVITDKVNWTLVSANYVAAGGEQYITIGLFTPDNSVTWQNVGGGSWNSVSYYIEDVAVYLSILLPVTLVDLRANLEKKVVQLEWRTESETGNDYFNVERSPDGTEFETLGRVDGAGNSTTAKDYGFTDTDPLSGMNYYRLKQTDTDGSCDHSNIVAVNNRSAIDISLYPNPTTGEFAVTGASGEIQVYDLFGRLVLTANEPQIDMSAFPKGVYLIRVEERTEKLVLCK